MVTPSDSLPDGPSPDAELAAEGPTQQGAEEPVAPPSVAERPRDPAVASVERIRERLAELDQRPVDQHVEVYEDLHAQLTAALRAVNSATNPGQGG